MLEMSSVLVAVVARVALKTMMDKDKSTEGVATTNRGSKKK